MENPDKARENLKGILNQKEYQVYYDEHRNFLQIWWDNIKTWFRDVLSEWFSNLNPSTTFADTLLIILIGIIVLLFLLVVFLVFRSVRRKRALREQMPFLSSNEMEWSVDRHLRKAENYEDEENYSLAIRHQFLALLLYCHKQEWLVAKTWKTNWDYFAELKQSDTSRAQAFDELARTFDEAFYGEHPIKYEAYQIYKQKVQKWVKYSDEEERQDV